MRTEQSEEVVPEFTPTVNRPLEEERFLCLIPEATKIVRKGSEPLPTVIGDYQILETIGQGSFAKVKRGIHRFTNEQVAIKVVFKSKITKVRQLQRILREIRFLRALDHPHIVKVYDVFETKDHVCIVMEYVNGGELFDYIVAQQRLRPKVARKLFRQIISALDYCHQNHIIHRDLKPENILLNDRGDVKIVDFGFSNAFHDGQLLNTFCGSPYYAAPEMNQGIRYTGTAVDVWSAGVILYTCLTGQLPFDGENVVALYKSIRSGIFSIPSFLTLDEADLLKRMLAVDAEERVTIEEIKYHTWTNEGYPSLLNNYLPPRPSTIFMADDEIIAELAAFHTDMPAADILNELEFPNSPITAFYHLIKERRMATARRALLDSITTSAQPSSQQQHQQHQSASKETVLSPISESPQPKEMSYSRSMSPPSLRPVAEEDQHHMMSELSLSSSSGPSTLLDSSENANHDQSAEEDATTTTTTTNNNNNNNNTVPVIQTSAAPPPAPSSIVQSNPEPAPPLALTITLPSTSSSPSNNTLSNVISPLSPSPSPLSSSASLSPSSPQPPSQQYLATSPTKAQQHTLSPPLSRRFSVRNPFSSSTSPASSRSPSPLPDEDLACEAKARPHVVSAPRMIPASLFSSQVKSSFDSGLDRKMSAPASYTPSHSERKSTNMPPPASIVSRAATTITPAGVAAIPKRAIKTRRMSVTQIVNYVTRSNSSSPAPSPVSSSSSLSGSTVSASSTLTSSTSSSSSSETTPRARVLGVFTLSTTSRKTSAELIADAKTVIIRLGMTYSYSETASNVLLYSNATSSLDARIEVVQLDHLGLNGLRFKRVRGSIWAHKREVDRIISLMRL